MIKIKRYKFVTTNYYKECSYQQHSVSTDFITILFLKFRVDDKTVTICIHIYKEKLPTK